MEIRDSVMLDKKVFIPFTLDSVGIYPYPEAISLFTAFFENTATKEQLDDVNRYIKGTKSTKKITEAYDYYQVNYLSKDSQER